MNELLIKVTFSVAVKCIQGLYSESTETGALTDGLLTEETTKTHC